MIRRLLAVLLVGAAAIGLHAQEAITRTTPITPPAITSYQPGSLTVAVLPAPRIFVTIVGTDGVNADFSYPCASPCAFTTDAQVLTLITTLNTANLSTRSLWRRVFDRLIVDFPTRFSGGATVQ